VVPLVGTGSGPRLTERRSSGSTRRRKRPERPRSSCASGVSPTAARRCRARTTPRAFTSLPTSTTGPRALRGSGQPAVERSAACWWGPSPPRPSKGCPRCSEAISRQRSSGWPSWPPSVEHRCVHRPAQARAPCRLLRRRRQTRRHGARSGGW